MHIYIDDNSELKKEFQLPSNLYPEMSRTNPFLTDEGSQSIPMSLPASEHNLKLLGYPQRGTSKKRPIEKLSVILSDGVMWMRGTLYIEESSLKEGIKCTFYTNEGQLYEKMKDLKLSDITWPILTYTASTNALKAKYWMDKFLRIINGLEPQAEEYAICNINTKMPFYIDKKQKNYNFNLLLNELNSEVNPVSFYAMSEQTYYDKAEDGAMRVTVPVGYGITPFLRIGYVLRNIFSFFQYKLDENIFDTNKYMRRLILLNNTVDTIVKGNIDFRQLLPDDVTIEDFINAIRVKFGLEFVLIKDHIKISFWNDVLNKNPDQDLSKKATDSFLHTVVKRSALSIELPTLTEQLDPRKNALDPNYFKYKYILTHKSESDYEEVELKIEDKTPLFSSFITSRLHIRGALVGLRGQIMSLTIGDVSHKNTELNVDGKTEDTKDVKMDISLCFVSETLSEVEINASSVFKYVGADTTTPFLSLCVNTYTMNGRLRPGEVLFENNIYNKLYFLRDKMLKQANQQITFQSNLTTHEIVSMDISTPKTVNGQKVLIERIDYIVGRPELCKVTARTLHLFENEPIP